MKGKNEHIASLHLSLNLLIKDVRESPKQTSNNDTWIKPSNPSKINKKNEDKKNSVITSNRYTVVLDSDEVNSSDEDDNIENSDDMYKTRKSITSHKQSIIRRPNVVTQNHPEGNHLFIKNKKSNDKNGEKNKEILNKKTDKPLILLVGDSTIKNVTSFDLRKECKEASIMVRPYRGGKIKNIKNMIMDVLDDKVEPTAICIHASTNDIGSGRHIEDIVGDMENLLKLIQGKGIMPIISLPTVRNDKFSQKINVLNGQLVQLCRRYEVCFIEHRDITSEHLNKSGLHINSKFNHLMNSNFAQCFNYLLDHM